MSNKEKNLTLKKCASTNELGILSVGNLNLREAKSYAGSTAEPNTHDNVTNQIYQNTNDKCLELFYKDDIQKMDKNGIATKDSFTDELYYVNEEFLNQKGKKYSANDIAWTWKKDCRMWLWKNGKEYKKNRSVAEVKHSTMKST